MEMCYLYDGVPVDRSSSTGRDADGTRVAKGRITAWSCDPAVNGFQTTNDYILGPSGEQVTEMAMDANNSMAWQHTNVYAAGKLLATYDNDGLHFYLNDPLPGSPATGLRRWGGLGTRRAQTDYAGVLEQTCSSLPFGDALTCSGGNLQAPTEHHFTGKERDTESGNDYFGARYYASSMGRFMSPDWSAKVAPVPYAKMDNPQTLNLYAYVGNNPMTRTDPTGHTCKSGDTFCHAWDKIFHPDRLPPTPPPQQTQPVPGSTPGAPPATTLSTSTLTPNKGINPVTNAVIDQAVQKFKVCLNTPGKGGLLGTLAVVNDLKPDMPEKPEGLNAQMGVSPSDGEVAPAPLMEKNLGGSPGETAYSIFAQRQCAKENPYVFLSPNVQIDAFPSDVF